MKKYISVIAVLFAVGITGCKKDYLSLENNPNQPSVTTPQLLLPSAEVTAANIYMSDYPHYGVWGGYWTTSGNYVPNASINEYQITTATGNASWDALYLNLSNWNALKLISTTSDLANYQAIAKIMTAYDFQQLVDNYNDVAYSQAFDPKNLAPAYDKGVDVYHDLGKQLDAAIKLINDNPNATVPTTDVMFKGNMTSWKQFANTLKLRLAIRVYLKLGVSDPLVTDLASTASEGYLTADAAVNPGYVQSNSGAGASQESPFFNTYGNDVNGNATFGNVYYRANDYAVKFYHSNNDPRVAAFYVAADSPPAGTPADGIRGNIFGDIAGNLPNPNTSGQGPGLLVSASQNAVLISGFESDFLQAEGIQTNLIPASTTTFATAQAAYEAGITASFAEVGLTSAQATTYFTQPTANVSWAASSGNPVKAIITQKWAAMNGWFNLEAYNEYRRTGYPALPTSVDPSAIGTNLPTRVLYPTSELSTNPVSVGKEGAINPLTSKIFWAQ